MKIKIESEIGFSGKPIFSGYKFEDDRWRFVSGSCSYSIDDCVAKCKILISNVTQIVKEFEI